MWIQARVFLNGEVLLRRVTARYVETHTMNLETCGFSIVAHEWREPYKSRQQNGPAFSDRDLRALVRNRTGLIYLWSPNMPYSYLDIRQGTMGLPAIRQIAAEMNLPLTVLLDPGANYRHALRVTGSSPWLGPTDARLVRSIELSFRALLNHYPVLLAYRDGKLARFGYPGIGTREEYHHYIKDVFDELAP